MGFNFSNPIELITQFNQFKRWLSNCQQDPKKLLMDELKKRNVSDNDLEQLMQTANQLKNVLGVK